MKKVFVLIMDAYDDFGAHMGSAIVNVYTTLEFAQEKVNKLKSFAEEKADQFISYQYTIEESILEGD